MVTAPVPKKHHEGTDTWVELNIKFHEARVVHRENTAEGEVTLQFSCFVGQTDNWDTCVDWIYTSKPWFSPLTSRGRVVAADTA